eukprot:3532534-Rhodomonas_salina.2
MAARAVHSMPGGPSSRRVTLTCVRAWAGRAGEERQGQGPGGVLHQGPAEADDARGQRGAGGAPQDASLLHRLHAQEQQRLHQQPPLLSLRVVAVRVVGWSSECMHPSVRQRVDTVRWRMLFVCGSTYKVDPGRMVRWQGLGLRLRAVLALKTNRKPRPCSFSLCFQSSTRAVGSRCKCGHRKRRRPVKRAHQPQGQMAPGGRGHCVSPAHRHGRSGRLSPVIANYRRSPQGIFLEFVQKREQVMRIHVATVDLLAVAVCVLDEDDGAWFAHCAECCSEVFVRA